jgi:1,4-alpha-glucan branching enzyme
MAKKNIDPKENSEPVKKYPAKKAVAKTAAAKTKTAAAEKEGEKAVKKTAKKAVAPIVNTTNMLAVEPYSRFTDFDVSLFRSGKHYKLYEKFGAHVVEYKGVVGTYFSVWAPNAQFVSVIGNFNGWNRGAHQLYSRWDSSGIWEGFIANVGVGETYKYFIKSSSG